MTTPKKGDRVRLTVEGEVTYVGGGGYLELRPYGSSTVVVAEATPSLIVEILQKPLAVGDEVTEENKHLLPERFILASVGGHAWSTTPARDSFKQYGPFTLVYIHEQSE